MSEKGRLTELEEARRNLVLEAELRRSELRLEAAELHQRLLRLRTARFAIPMMRPLLALGAVVAGAVAARHPKKLVGWLPSALNLLRWFRRHTGG